METAQCQGKYLEQSKEIELNWTGSKNFYISFWFPLQKFYFGKDNCAQGYASAQRSQVIIISTIC